MTKLTQSQRNTRCVLPLEQAVYRAVKDKAGSMGAIADIHGLNPNTVRLQYNPTRACHTLSPELIEYALEHTQDTRILDSVCAAHGQAGWYLLPSGDTTDTEIMKSLGELSQRFADLTSEFMTALADGRIVPDEVAALDKVGMALMGEVQHVLKLAKDKMEML